MKMSCTQGIPLMDFFLLFSEHLWPVTVREKGLSSTGAVTPGSYRLCLTNTELRLVRVSHEQPDIVFQVGESTLAEGASPGVP